MSLTYLVLSVPVNDCLGNVCRQLFTWMVTCSDVGLIFSEKHELFGKIITFKAVFSTWIIFWFFFCYDSELFSKRKTMCKTKWTYSLFLLRKNNFLLRPSYLQWHLSGTLVTCQRQTVSQRGQSVSVLHAGVTCQTQSQFKQFTSDPQQRRSVMRS